MGSKLVFDQPHYDRLNAARGERVRELLQELQPRLGLRTAIDVGCGTGYFSGMLQSMGFGVTGVDGRQENVEESQRRHPGIVFKQMNAEDASLAQMGKFDLVFCFGLLYHLENPMLAIRNLRAMTEHLLLVESVIFQGSEPVMALIDESPEGDQGLNHFAFYPTESCLIKMIYRAGFSSVYELSAPPEHREYVSGRASRRTRTMLAASLEAVRVKLLTSVPEPHFNEAPWDADVFGQQSTLSKLKNLIPGSLQERARSIKRHSAGKRTS